MIPASGQIPEAQSLQRVATIGLHSSASTWVFNIVRELLNAAYGPAAVLSLYADEAGQLPAAELISARHVLVKSHHGSAELDGWLARNRFETVLSIRDPRDAAMSMAQRFKTPLALTAGWIRADCERLLRLASLDHPVLKYESRFFDDVGTVVRLADLLGLAVDQGVMRAIFATYKTDAVRVFAQSLKDRPSGEVTKIAGRFAMDQVTQINETHIGDARSGKWRDLPEQARTALSQMYAPFIARFGY